MFNNLNIPADMATDYKHASNEELLALYKLHNNTRAFTELFDRFNHLVFAVAMKYLHCSFKAEDVTLEIFEKIVAKRQELNITNFNAWVYSVTKNRCLDILEKRSEVNVLATEQLELIKSDRLADDNGLVAILLHRFIKGLKTEQRTCIELFYFEGYDYSKIASVTGYNYNKIKSALQNGKRSLRLLFEKTPGFRYELVQSFFG